MTATIMLIVAASRALVVPVYLAELRIVALAEPAVGLLNVASFGFMVAALAVAAIIIVGAMLQGRRHAID